MRHLTTRILVGTLLMIGLVALSAGSALANVAANTQIINEATLSYDDGTGTKTSTTQVTVTVSLVPAPPSITPGPPQETAYNGLGTTLTNSFFIRASANGPDNYTLATSITGSSNTTGPTASITSGSPIELGATVTYGTSTQSNLVVPADGTTDTPAEVNGIEAGDFVYVNGETREVSSVVDNASGTSSIILISALTNPAPPTGTLVAEQKTVSVDVTAGNIGTVGTDITVDKNLSATSVADTDETVTSGDVTDTYTSGAATLYKYVRNTNTPSGSGTATTYDGNQYFQTGVKGAPNEILEYLLVSTNTGGGAVTSSFVTDIIPTDFVTLDGDAYGATPDLAVTYVSYNSSVLLLTGATGDDAAEYDSGTLTIWLGDGADNGIGGDIPGDTGSGPVSVYALYQVFIKP